MRARALAGLLCFVGGSLIVGSPAVEAVSPVAPIVVCFAAGSTAISSSGAKALEAAATQSQQIGRRSRLEVEARTDAAEARSHGINLSADRGSAIRARLMLLGVPTENIQIKAFADSAPLIESNREDPQNRCATVWLSSAP